MAKPWPRAALPLLALLLAAAATALPPGAVAAPRARSAVPDPRARSAVPDPRAPSAVAAPRSLPRSPSTVAAPAAAGSALTLEPDCRPSETVHQILLECDVSYPTTGCCDAVLASLHGENTVACLCAAARDPDLERAGYNAAAVFHLYTVCGGRVPRQDPHALCLEARITQTIIPQADSTSHRRMQKEIDGSCDAGKLAWDVAAHCLDSLDTKKKLTPACCTPLLAAAESRECFCNFIRELKAELSPVTRKEAHLLHRRCGGLHRLPRCFPHGDEPQGQDDGVRVPPSVASSPPPTPVVPSSPPPPAPALKKEPPAYAQLFWCILQWILSHARLEAGVLCSALAGAAVEWTRRKLKNRRARRRTAGTVGDMVADLGLHAAEIGLDAVSTRMHQEEQENSTPPLSAGTRSRGTSMDSSSSSEHDHKEELLQEEEEKEKVCKPQAMAPPAIEASGWFSFSFTKWW